MPTLPGFQYEEGPYKIRTTTVVASAALNQGDALSLDNAGTTDEMSAAASGEVVRGIFHGKPKLATDSDYASITTHDYIVVVPNESQLWRVNVEAGTADQTTDVGYQADLNSADGITLSSSTNDDFQVTKVINSSTVIGFFLP